MTRLSSRTALRDPRQRGLLVLFGLAMLSTAALLAGVLLGSVRLHPADLAGLWSAALGAADPAQQILALRLPRVLAAFAVGGLLAVAGALMQVLLVNPLADPYILGVSGGSAVGALLAMWLGLAELAIDACAFLGALLALVLVLLPGLGGRQQGEAGSPHRLLLTGVVLSAGWSALITLILTLAPDVELRGMLVWLMGDLGGVVRWQGPMAMLAATVVLVRPLAADLNVMLRGERTALALGVPLGRRRLQIYALASLATAIAVTTAGAIGFVGLLVPHALRLVLGNDQRLLLPASALAGGTLLALSDTAARSAWAPTQLPVGVLTALLGVPGFLWLLSRRSRPVRP